MALNDVLDILDEYVDDCLRPPEPRWPANMIRQRSYERWAVEEFREALIASYGVLSPTQVIMELISRWEDGIEDMYIVSNDVIDVFVTAIDTLEDISELFL